MLGRIGLAAEGRPLGRGLENPRVQPGEERRVLTGSGNNLFVFGLP